jgi:hypothetical protein
MLARRKISLAYKAIVGASICRTSSLSRAIYAFVRSGFVLQSLCCRLPHVSCFVPPSSTVVTAYIGLG